jgi:hypothetical protein
MRPSRITYIFAAFMLLLASGQYIRVHASSPQLAEVPKIIQFGLDTYKSEGPEAAVRAWVKGGPFEGSKDSFSQISVLRQIQQSYGSYSGFEVIRIQDVSASVRLIYLTLNFEKGPVFGRFVVYRSQQGSVLTAINFSAKPEEIVPNLVP